MKKTSFVPYYTPEWTFEDYGPAYRFARETCPQCGGNSFEEVEPRLERIWHTRHSRKDPLSWEKALPAVRRVWYRLQECSLQ